MYGELGDTCHVMEDTRMLEEPDLFISLNNAGGHGCSTLGR